MGRNPFVNQVLSNLQEVPQSLRKRGRRNPFVNQVLSNILVLLDKFEDLGRNPFVNQVLSNNTHRRLQNGLCPHPSRNPFVNQVLSNLERVCSTLPLRVVIPS